MMMMMRVGIATRKMTGTAGGTAHDWGREGITAVAATTRTISIMTVDRREAEEVTVVNEDGGASTIIEKEEYHYR